ncbi:MAG: right-handed parallel beta-helix repeat-containing protein [bacterium]
MIGTVTAVTVLVPAHATEARVLRVPEDFPSVLAGVDAAVSDDSVLVGPGTWNQGETRAVQVCANFVNRWCVAFLKPGICLIATAGPDATILDGGPQAGVVVITVLHNLPGTPPTHVEGFTITGGGAGVSAGCTSSPLELVNCRIVGNGNAAISFGECQLRVADCVISDTHVIYRTQGAVASNSGADVEFIRTRFERNEKGSVDLLGATRVLVEDCDFVDHHDARSNVVLSSCPDVTIRRSRFFRSTATNHDLGGGAAFLQECTALFEFCTFANDSAPAAHGGAVLVDVAGSYEFRNNTFYRCYATGNGGALAAFADNLDFEENVVADCSGPSAVAHFGAGTLTTGCDVYWANQNQNFYQWPPAATDIFADPRFCNAPALDFRVDAASPCLPGNGNPSCTELIGALGQGCGVVSIEPLSWGRLKGIYRTEGGDRP